MQPAVRPLIAGIAEIMRAATLLFPPPSLPMPQLWGSAGSQAATHPLQQQLLMLKVAPKSVSAYSWHCNFAIMFVRGQALRLGPIYLSLHTMGPAFTRGRRWKPYLCWKIALWSVASSVCSIQHIHAMLFQGLLAQW